MSLKLQQLKLNNFRSFSHKKLEFSNEISILVGHNAVGKTNTIEAIQLLSSGISFRHPMPSQLIREKENKANISARFEGDGRLVDVSCEITDGRKRFIKNGKSCRAHDIVGTCASVLFTPDDLSIVKRGSSYRRDELDVFARQINKSYAKVLSSYTKAVHERNQLLKKEKPDLLLLEAWDSVIAKGGATLLHARLRLFSRLTEKMTHIYKTISKGEELTCTYLSSTPGVDSNTEKEEIEGKLLLALTQSRQEDIQRQQTTKGPHRDDIAFMIQGRAAKEYGSQGQQRSVALALKMSEVIVAEEITQERPLLLLDDVMSELDESRRDEVLRFTLNGTQAIITTTNLGYFSNEILGCAKVVNYD